MRTWSSVKFLSGLGAQRESKHECINAHGEKLEARPGRSHDITNTGTIGRSLVSHVGTLINQGRDMMGAVP